MLGEPSMRYSAGERLFAGQDANSTCSRRRRKVTQFSANCYDRDMTLSGRKPLVDIARELVAGTVRPRRAVGAPPTEAEAIAVVAGLSLPDSSEQLNASIASVLAQADASAEAAEAAEGALRDVLLALLAEHARVCEVAMRALDLPTAASPGTNAPGARHAHLAAVFGAATRNAVADLYRSTGSGLLFARRRSSQDAWTSRSRCGSSAARTVRARALSRRD
jgi:hypothetical protein